MLLENNLIPPNFVVPTPMHKHVRMYSHGKEENISTISNRNTNLNQGMNLYL